MVGLHHYNVHSQAWVKELQVLRAPVAAVWVAGHSVSSVGSAWGWSSTEASLGVMYLLT